MSLFETFFRDIRDDPTVLSSPVFAVLFKLYEMSFQYLILNPAHAIVCEKHLDGKSSAISKSCIKTSPVEVFLALQYK